MNTYLTINGVVQHGITERRSEYVISFYSGQHWLGREEHWESWIAIPPESSSQWKPARLFIPDSLKPVLAILPQPVVLKSLIIPAGLHFAMYSDDRTWKIYQRIQGARISSNSELEENRCWIDVGLKQVSSWLELPPLNERLRSDF